MNNFMSNMGGMGGFPGFGSQPNAETAVIADTSEQVKVSALALLKMLKHCTP
jgi:hypothetical protein